MYVQMKKDKDNRLEGTKLGMEKLYMHVLKTELPGKNDIKGQI